MRDPAIATAIGQFAVIQSAASSVGLEVTALIVRDAGEIERAVTQFGRRPNGSLIVTASALGTVHRDLIIRLAAQYQLPAVYPYRFFVTDGGLMAYGPDTIDQYRQAAGYVLSLIHISEPTRPY